MSLAMTTMARPKKRAPISQADDRPRKRKGRPKGAGRITSRYAIVASPEHQTWMREFMAFLGETEVSDVFREGLRKYAESAGFRPPPRR